MACLGQFREKKSMSGCLLFCPLPNGGINKQPLPYFSQIFFHTFFSRFLRNFRSKNPTVFQHEKQQRNYAKTEGAIKEEKERWKKLSFQKMCRKKTQNKEVHFNEKRSRGGTFAVPYPPTPSSMLTKLWCAPKLWGEPSNQHWTGGGGSDMRRQFINLLLLHVERP